MTYPRRDCCPGCNVKPIIANGNDRSEGKSCVFIGCDAYELCPCKDCVLMVMCSIPCSARINARETVLENRFKETKI